MFGKDGKFYDPRYDFDRDGKLNRKEFGFFIEDEIDKDEDDILSDLDFYEDEDINEAEELLSEEGIELYEFELMSGEEKYSLIKENDWDIDLFEDYFDPIELIHLEIENDKQDDASPEEDYYEDEEDDDEIDGDDEDEDDGEETEYYEDKVFSYFGIDIDTMRYGSEESRRKLLNEHNIQYDDFNDYFAMFDIGEKWRGRASNDLSLLAQILDEMGKYSFMKDRGITEWTNGDVVIKFVDND